MKISIIVVAIVFLVHAQCAESRRLSSWLPTRMLDSITNRTSQITGYVKEKGRNLKKYYLENVRNKITTYLGFNENTPVAKELPHDKQTRLRNYFNGYIADAEKSETTIFDKIAPTKTEYRCSDEDPTVLMTTLQMIAKNGYPAEGHTVITADGYILSLHRIPYSKRSDKKISSRQTVYLHHGLLGSSADWVIAGPEKGLAYILSDAGYDVWMANVRGNTYSRAHISRDVNSFEFWNFTFHDVGMNDLPAAIDYIMSVKGWSVKINYIGHSMGTTVLFTLLSTKTQYNKILRAGFALAPVAYMTDIKSPLRLLARFANNLEYLMKLLGANEFLPQNSVLRWLSKHACEINHYEEVICENSLFVICGHDEKQFNKTLLPIILGHTPAGASTKTLVHYAQEIRNAGKFQQFDYGTEGNLRQYGNAVPPEYPVHSITLPIALFSAENDWLASDADVTSLYIHLANPIEHYVVPMKEFNHIDFLWAIDAPKLVYNKLLQLLEEGNTAVKMFDIDDNAIAELNIR